MSEVAFTIAGGMTLARDGVRIEDHSFGGTQLRLVTAILLVGRHQRWGMEGLAGQLWPDEPPDRWRPAVRGLVSRVRRLLADVGIEDEVVTNVAGQYVVDLPGLSVDIEVARSDLVRARAALGGGDMVAADRLAGRARRVLSRPVLGEIESPWLEQLRRSLADDHLEALLLLGDARRRAGRVTAARSVLAQAVEGAPLREDAWRSLMQVEFDAGNLAAALDVYAACRRHLGDELGVDPSPATQALHVRMLQTAPADGGSVSDVAGATLAGDVRAPAAVGGPRVGRGSHRGQHDASQTDLLERGDVLRDLSGLVERARDGDGHVVLLRGEAGIGKTVVARAMASAAATQAQVLWGACDDLLAPRPLGPVWDMSSADADLATVLRGDDQRLVRQALIEVFTNTRRPTVAVFEDVHWADGATLDLLTLIGRRIADTHTLVVMTFREVPSDHPLGGVLGDLPASHVRSIRLQPLSRRAVAALADGRDVPAARVFEQTGGNPFLVSAMLADPGDRIPATVSDLMGSLLARLTGKAERLVQQVSVVPGRAEVALLDEIDPDLVASFAAADDVGLLRMQDVSVAFRHELARTAIEAGLPEPLRRGLHLQVLAAGERLGYDAARLAHHARHARDVDAMVRLLPDAAREAAARQSHREAITQLDALKDHLHHLPTHEQADLYELWATEEEFADGRGLQHALAAVDLRRQLGDASGLGAALVWASRSAWTGGDFARAAELASEAVDVLEDVGGEDLALAYTQLARTATQDLDPELALHYSERALALAPEPSQARALALTTAGVERNLSAYPDGTEMLEEAAAIAESLGLAWELERARGNLIGTALAAKDIDRARHLNDLALTALDDDVARTMVPIHMSAVIDTAAGDYDAAEAVLRDLLDHPRLEAALRWFAEGALAELLVRRGDPGAGPAVQRLDTRAREAGQVQDRVWAGTLSAQHLWVFQLQDDRATNRNLAVFAETVDRAPPWDVAELALWLWLDGHLDAIPDRAAEPVRWLGEGHWKRAADWFADRSVPFEQAVALSLGDADARLDALRIAHRIGARALAARLRGESTVSPASPAVDAGQPVDTRSS